jgi:hypothetical protein
MNITFFLYIIKDALEFGGLLPSATPARQMKNALYKFEILTEKNTEITKVLA